MRNSTSSGGAFENGLYNTYVCKRIIKWSVEQLRLTQGASSKTQQQANVRSSNTDQNCRIGYPAKRPCWNESIHHDEYRATTQARKVIRKQRTSSFAFYLIVRTDVLMYLVDTLIESAHYNVLLCRGKEHILCSGRGAQVHIRLKSDSSL